MGECPPQIVKRRIVRFDAGTVEEMLDDVLVESSIKLFWNGELVFSGLITRCNLVEFTIGHLISRGLVASPGDIHQINVKGDKIEANGEQAQSERLLRRPLKDFSVKAWKLITFSNKFRSLAWIYRETASTHTGALISNGEIVSFYEDISRWNVADKLIGSAFTKSIHPDIVIMSSRMVSPLLRKFLVLGVPIIASISAPSEGAIELAEEAGITLIGFLRGQRFNIYTNEFRIIF
ncbi:MAG: hypothetical protein DRQ10_00200 [Candidatus Hydrothermota bacterium]|nr:MAG: hypothetical protein DRQ10_00200 [Candidatus Hydrothermae bacterium]